MKPSAVKLWYDPEGDYLEVTFERKEGSCRRCCLREHRAQRYGKG